MLGALLVLASYGVSLSSIGLYSLLYERKKKKLGYVNRDRCFSYKKFFTNSRDCLENWLLFIFPFVNLYYLIPILRFNWVSKSDIEHEYNDGYIMPVEKAKKILDTGYHNDDKLAFKVLRVRKAQMKYQEYLDRKKRKYDETLSEIDATYRDLTLPEKVVAVRKLQSKNNMVNRVIPFSEYGPDERIALLLAELELAYKEKAKLEGTDLDKEVALLLENRESKE